MLQPRPAHLNENTPPGLFLAAGEYGARIFVAATEAGPTAILLDPWADLPAFALMPLHGSTICEGIWLGRAELGLDYFNDAYSMPKRVGILRTRRSRVYLKCNEREGHVIERTLTDFTCSDDPQGYSAYYVNWSLNVRAPSGAKITLFESSSVAQWAVKYCVRRDSGRKSDVSWLSPKDYGHAP